MEGTYPHRLRNTSRLHYQSNNLCEIQNYPPSADTWEPRDSLIDGAESILVDYLRRQEKKGIRIWDDGTRKSKMVDMREEKPISKDSGTTAEPGKKKKREIGGDDVNTSFKDKEPKKRRKEVENSRSPIPVTEPSATKTKSEPPPIQSPAANEKENRKLAPTPPIAKTANNASMQTKATAVSDSEDEARTLAEIKASLPKEALSTQEKPSPTPVLGSSLHTTDDNWDVSYGLFENQARVYNV